ncbi:MAG: hypothetical protein GX607_17540 [Myxococcales bacterium]|jgi:hypothetical protein|nr:hypothetical protein [Myxococcales bacterium]
MREWSQVAWIVGVLLVGCVGGGGAVTSGNEATEPRAEEELEDLPEASTVPREDASDETEEVAPAPEAAVEPDFRPGMSVDEAIAAVPQSAQRVNIEQEALAAPLMRTELYEPCEVRGNQSFQLRVAVWEGRAVGVDVATKPQNEKLAGCLREQVSSVTWPDKVKSLNTVEFSY